MGGNIWWCEYFSWVGHYGHLSAILLSWFWFNNMELWAHKEAKSQVISKYHIWQQWMCDWWTVMCIFCEMRLKSSALLSLETDGDWLVFISCNLWNYMLPYSHGDDIHSITRFININCLFLRGSCRIGTELWMCNEFGLHGVCAWYLRFWDYFIPQHFSIWAALSTPCTSSSGTVHPIYCPDFFDKLIMDEDMWLILQEINNLAGYDQTFCILRLFVAYIQQQRYIRYTLL